MNIFRVALTFSPDATNPFRKGQLGVWRVHTHWKAPEDMHRPDRVTTLRADAHLRFMVIPSTRAYPNGSIINPFSTVKHFIHAKNRIHSRRQTRRRRQGRASAKR